MNTKTRPTLSPLLLAVLALLSAFTPLSIDMYLPALPVIAVDLQSSAGDIQLTLSAFMIAFGVGQVFYGPAGDRFGRRPVILIGLVIYVLTSIGCAFAAASCWRARWYATWLKRITPRAPCRS
ncbi:MAG: MFS transporter DHA1 family bicyclomycin/chloramphenicol resistance protein [Rhodospirillaceae bacterium]|nr:MAG: MFS transporter DHA1 family bicyclomycin/chloramphenicol resistance protein [Rhodospirillaceae bacterium]